MALIPGEASWSDILESSVQPTGGPGPASPLQTLFCFIKSSRCHPGARLTVDPHHVEWPTQSREDFGGASHPAGDTGSPPASPNNRCSKGGGTECWGEPRRRGQAPQTVPYIPLPPSGFRKLRTTVTFSSERNLLFPPELFRSGFREPREG